MFPRWREFWPFVLVAAAILAAHAAAWRDSEPYFNNDETRHVMTGVFVRDALADGGWREPRAYATRYYLQYPALGLLAWPPLFHLVEGVAMAALGSSFAVGRAVVLAFLVLACLYAYRLALRTSGDRFRAALATLLLGLTPLVFQFSRQVMLEVPTLAWALAAIYYFERYLGEARPRDAVFAGLAAAGAALTRFDAVFLLPYFALRLLALQRLDALRRPAVWAGILLAVLLAGPYYALTWKWYGGAIASAAASGTGADSAAFRAARNLPYYPLGIVRQAGVPVALLAALGLLGWLVRRERAIGVSLALLAAVYLTFTPLAELEDRHVIYWLPALCLLAAEPIAGLPAWGRVVGALLLAALLAGLRGADPPRVVHGYADAARALMAQERPANVVFFDGTLSGGFIYQVRRHDPLRAVTVLRGDKLVYGVLSDPAGGYAEHAKSPEEILALLHRYDPDWIVLEQPPALHASVPAAALLRRTLREHPERYEHVASMDVPLRTDHPAFAGVVLEFYRPRVRNPQREALHELPMLNLREPLRVR